MEVAGCRLLVAGARGEGGVFRTPFRRLPGCRLVAGAWGKGEGTPQRSLLAFEGPPEPEVASCGVTCGRNSPAVSPTGGVAAGCRLVAGNLPASTCWNPGEKKSLVNLLIC